MNVVFLGDSLMYGWLDEGRPFWDESFASLGVRNFGIPGDTTHDVLQRIGNGDLDRAAPELVVLLIGTNDLGSGASVGETSARIRACVAALRERYPVCEILLLALFPRGDGFADGRMARVRGVNDAIAVLGDDERVAFADLTAVFLDRRGRIRQELFDADLLHLAAAGYRAWATALRSYL